MVDNSEAIEAALASGRAFMNEILAAAEMASTDEIGALLGLTPNQVVEADQARILLALGPAGGRRYPRWQVIEGKPIPQLDRIFRWIDVEFTVWAFLQEPLDILQNRTPLKAIADGDIDSVVSVAESVCMGGYL